MIYSYHIPAQILTEIVSNVISWQGYIMSDDLEHKVQMCELHDAKNGMAEIRGRKDLQK